MLNQRCLRCVSEIVRPFRTTVCQFQSLAQPRQYATIAQEPSQASVERTSKVAKTATKLESIAISDQTKPQDSNTKRTSYPPNVVASYLAPIKHEAKHRIPVASLQLRSYSVRNLEFFADFALRVAAYLNLPASGPVPLPKKIERWTVIRSNFIFKKSQENFERITMKRLITVYDGAPEVVEIWLAALRKWQFYGVGMKANIWEFSGLDVAASMDKTAEQVQKELDAKLANFGWANSVAGEKSIQDMFLKQGMRKAGVPHLTVRDEIKDVKNVDRIS